MGTTTSTTVPRVEIADPSAEGPAIADALRSRGFHVVERPIASLEFGSDAAVLIIAGDAPDAHSVVRALRRARGTAATPVVLLGGPPDHVLADAHYARPVPIDRLVRKVETYLAPPETRLKPAPSESAATPPRDAPAAPSLPLVERTLRLAAGQDPNVSFVPWQPPERTMQLVDDGKGDGKLAPAAPPPSGVPPPAEPVASRSGPPTPPPATPPRGPAPPFAPLPTTPPEPSSPRAAPASAPPPAAEVSPRLQKMFRAADKRVFPDLARLEIRFPLGDESPDVLVPAELLEPASQPIEPLEEDPLEQFTYVGAVPEHLGSSPSLQLPRAGLGTSPPPPSVAAARDEPEEASGDTPAEPTSATGSIRRSRPPPPPSVPGPSVAPSGAQTLPKVAAAPRPPTTTNPGRRAARASEPAPPPSPPLTPSAGSPMPPITPVDVGAWTVTDPILGEATADGRGRRGRIEDGGGLRVLWRIAELRLDGRLALALDLPAGEPVSLRIDLRAGDAGGIEGPVASRVLAQLRAERRAHEICEDEREAEAILERRVAAAALGRYELDARLRRAREALIHDAVAATGGAFELRAFDVPPSPAATPVLGAPLRAALIEGARRRLGADRVRRLLGHGALTVRLRGEADSVFAHAELEPELVALLRRHDGGSLDQLLAAADPAEGVAGAVFALSVAGALRVAPTESEVVAPTADPVAAIRGALESAAALAEDGDYFAILGAPRDASDRDLRAAYVARRRELRALALHAHGLDHLEPLRSAAIEAVEEAYEILRDSGLRQAYRVAIA